MSIQVHCEGCGKLYQAEDRLAGKRMRCRQCGTVFAIPGGELLGDTDDSLDQLAALNESFGGGDSTILGTSHVTNLPVPEDLPEVTGPTRRYNVRLTYPGAAAVDRWLPIVLTIGGTLWVVLTAFHNDSAAPGLTAARVIVMFFVYLALIFPMALKGVQLAARDLHFALPRTSTWRALATFMPTFVLGAVLWMVSGGQTFALILGLIAGFRDMPAA